MSQLSLFSADLQAPHLADLAGLLAAHGQLTAGPERSEPGVVELSILLADGWRAQALLRECRVRDIPAETAAQDPADPTKSSSSTLPPAEPFPQTVLRTEQSAMLSAMAVDWTASGGKSVPIDLILTAGLLRCWTIAAGRPADVGFLLGLDPCAPDTHEPLAAACAAAGLAGSLLGVRGGGPAVRIVGYRRCSRLAEMIGTPPPEAPPGAFPKLGH
ncbi:MAG: hypothetical protein ABJD68_06190 [Nakamurella sp.]